LLTEPPIRQSVNPKGRNRQANTTARRRPTQDQLNTPAGPTRRCLRRGTARSQPSSRRHLKLPRMLRRLPGPEGAERVAGPAEGVRGAGPSRGLDTRSCRQAQGRWSLGSLGKVQCRHTGILPLQHIVNCTCTGIHTVSAQLYCRPYMANKLPACVHAGMCVCGLSPRRTCEHGCYRLHVDMISFKFEDPTWWDEEQSCTVGVRHIEDYMHKTINACRP
jgi:hypothetical protein